MSARPAVPRISKTRMEAFSDGVFAIAITLLVLEIAVPAASADDLFRALLELWPSYLAYLTSFFTIGIVWIKHSALTEALGSVDQLFLRINLVLLLAVSFLPFPTKLVAEYLHEEDQERVAVVVFGVVLLVINLLVRAVWGYARREGLVDPALTADERAAVTARLVPSVGFYAGAIALGVFFPVVAAGVYLGIAVFVGIPVRTLRDALRHADEVTPPGR